MNWMLPCVFFPVLFATSMGDGEGTDGRSKSIARTVEMENLSLDISSSMFSRDLLQRFRGSSRDSEAGKGEAADEEVELNLCLSLGGRFGNPLVRSSSIASCLPVTSDAAAPETPAAPAALARTASMPVETEEEWRKRKELQSLRRMEAKRRRTEKLRNLRIDKEGSGSGSGSGGLTMEDRKEIETTLRGRLDREKSLSALRRSDCGDDPFLRKGKASNLASVSDSDSRSTAAGSSEGGGGSLEEMPCVFTKGDGPGGRRVDGILYKYGKGKEVRIMCVCHGSFHSPADFVLHAGGTDVNNPLKHIVVNPNSSSLL